MDRTKAASLIFLISILLSLAGIVFVYTGSYFWCLREGAPYAYALKQFIAMVIGVGIALYIYKKVDYRSVAGEKVLWFLYGLANFLLVFVLIFGKEINNSKSWIIVGGFSFQPAEVAKVLTILFVSGYVKYRYYDIQSSWEEFLKFMALSFVPVFLILMEKDLGSSMILTIVIFAVLLVNGIKFKFLIPPLIGGVLMFTIAVITAPYRLARIRILFDPLKYYDLGKKYNSYQLVQAIISFAKGGLTGVGIGQGTQTKYFFLTFGFSDFIFSHIGEEVGALGALAVILAYFAILFLGFSIAEKSDEVIGKSMATGLSLYIFLEAMVHIGVNLGIIPTTGITLPFMSLGGSSLIASFLAVGFLMSIAKNLPPESKIKIRLRGKGRYA